MPRPDFTHAEKMQRFTAEMESLPDSYIEHGDPIGLLADCGLNAAGIEQSVRNRLSVLPA